MCEVSCQQPICFNSGSAPKVSRLRLHRRRRSRRPKRGALACFSGCLPEALVLGETSPSGDDHARRACRLRHRPDLVAAARRAEASKRNVAAAALGFAPTLAATASTDASTPLSEYDEQDFWSAGAQVRCRSLRRRTTRRPSGRPSEPTDGDARLHATGLGIVQ